ncbi:adenosylcobinamide kinase [Desulfovibrio sulfodismutans]|uniref:Adenosylcobinamide kinase n=1 Tax=Desulfolutivibrio sulfodismutans TaxID=63561 RepID=A0A7K3NM52_9BACT|nr:bifunctional adenosylcobinamide kinase/adenosylcobinamide-phosphate guanylyltransferase [Desulfolutivibrio sulfodismutans]NDY57260.1 adenosylcobinamide kinase [Desulfolutivibrio sulfodismutans]QLA13682.1 adenosylcobinamide kinase [Desulfolutivibrio sulfodismutans DSM 3696]
MIRLLLGGDKSGKSAHAMELFLAAPPPRRMAAMGRALDFEFRAQIEAHRWGRPPEIPVTEPGIELPRFLAGERPQGGSILVDSLDFWIFACAGEGVADDKVRELLDVLAAYAAPEAPEAVLVSVEAGLGPLAADAASRTFLRRLAALNQSVAALAADVRLVVAGLPVRLKGA